MYDVVKSQPKVFANLLDAKHDEPLKKGKGRWNPYLVSFFNCHLKKDKKSCRQIYD
jgi:hypothetical protein